MSVILLNSTYKIQ